MSEGKQLRLGQVARKLNVGRNTIISYLHDKGYEIDSNPNTKIDDSLFKILENAFEDSAVEKKVASNIKIGLEEKSNAASEFKKEIKEEKKEEPEKKEKTDKKEKPDKKEQGIKIIKKIKLDNNDTKRVASSDQSKKKRRPRKRIISKKNKPNQNPKNISESKAQDYIFGYFICNDISERQWQKEKGGQWVKGKSVDTFGPIGPYLVTSDEIKNLNDINLSLEVNGKKHQTGNTSDMIFNFNFLLSHISNFITLMPGDIVTTGTPPGVGMGMSPPVFLKNGDIMKLSVDNLGEQITKVIKE